MALKSNLAQSLSDGLDESRSDVLILGAGVSGLSAAYFLASQGQSVRVVNSYDHLGGNHISRDIGNYTYDIGAIFFWSDNCQFRMFEGLLDLCVPLDVSISKVSPSGRIIPYPFSVRDEILNRGLLEQAASIGAWSRLGSRAATTAPPRTSQDFTWAPTSMSETGLATIWTDSMVSQERR